jgi:hypothetical protein
LRTRRAAGAGFTNAVEGVYIAVAVDILVFVRRTIAIGIPAADARSARWASWTSRTRRAVFAIGTVCAGRASRTLRACVALWTDSALRACRAIFAGGARWTSRTLAVKCVVLAIAIGVLVLVGVAVSVQIPAADTGGTSGALCAGGACWASGAARAQTVEGVMRAIAVGVFRVIFLTITVCIPAA